MNVCTDFLNSLSRYLTFCIYRNFSFSMYIIDISYLVVYSVKMVDTSDYTVEYRGNIQCVQKVATVQKSMYYSSFI